MKIIAMDTSHIVLVHMVLHAERFEYYHCNGKLSIGINMLNLHKLVKTITNNDILTLFVDDSDMNHLGIKIENGDKNSRTSYKLVLLDLDNPNISIPPTLFNSVITLPSADFQKICRDMHNLAEYLEIKDVQNQLIFSCRGDFCSRETVLCDNNNNNNNNNNNDDGHDDRMLSMTQRRSDIPGSGVCPVPGPGAQEIVQGVFSLKHLVHFTKCTNLCSTVELFLKNDYPLIIRYAVASLGEIKLGLAPQSSSASCATSSGMGVGDLGIV
jgi:proliferating cell nuclear antigen